jgi:tRNA-specific 2-thiouridylase
MLDVPTLRMLRLPLGSDTKDKVREEAARRGLVGAGKGESQDLCFVPDGSYARFVEERAGDRVRPGWVVDGGGRRLGRHEGIHRFTLGQRKGLGVAAGGTITRSG